MAAHGRRGGGDGALVEALLQGHTQQEAAKRAHCSVRTVRRRLEDPAFRQLLAAGRREGLSRAVHLLAFAAGAAAQTLVDLCLHAEAENVRLGAASKLLEHATRGVELVDVLERLQRLEEAAARPTPGPMNGRPHVVAR